MEESNATRSHTCQSCGHTRNYYWHRLSPGLVGTLIKIRRGVGAKRENSVHLQRDLTGALELTKTEYNNAQKLRLHGLIAHDQDAGAGYWLLTRRGREFLDGDITVPRSVQSLNNRVTDHDHVHVSVTDVMDTRPVWDDYAMWHGDFEPAVTPLPQIALL